MPYFRVMLSGSGISCPITDGSDPAIGFYTHRDVRAPDVQSAGRLAIERVLAEWRDNGPYAAANRGAVPTLIVEDAFPIGFFKGIFGHKRAGYAFYARDD